MNGMSTIRLVGQETRSSNTIEVYCIAPTAIHYRCTRCNEEQEQPYIPEDSKGGWYRFECGNCGSMSKRTVQLEKFIVKEEGPKNADVRTKDV